MPFINKHRTAVVASAAILSLGGGTLAAAATSGSGTSTDGAGDTAQTQSERGKRGGPRGDISGLASSLGVTEAKLRAAFAATRPARGDRADRAAAMAAAIAKELGESQSDVAAVLEANRPERPADGQRPRRGARPDGSKLVAALASKFGISEAKAESALKAVHEAAREARHSAKAAALAEELGLDAAKVEAALEANRPARR